MVVRQHRHRWRLACLLVCLLAYLSGGSSQATPLTLAQVNAEQQSLLTLWFKLQSLTQVQPPYAWIRPLQTTSQQQQARHQLLTQLQQLQTQQPALAMTLAGWQSQLLANSDWREPGDWSPTQLMTQYRNSVPTAALAAIGSCQVPDWIEIWDARGVSRMPWQPRMHLRDLKRYGLTADWVWLVLPWGEIQRHGVANWNLDDTELLPGTRLLLPLPIAPKAATQLATQLSHYLAHLLPGDDCRQLLITHEGDDAHH